MSMNIYDLTESMKSVESAIDVMEFEEFADDEIVKALYESLLTTDEAFEQKAEGYARLCKNTEAYADALKEESDALNAKAKAAKNKVKRLKEAVRWAMDTLDKKKVQAGPFAWTIQTNGGVLPLVVDQKYIDDPQLLPEEFRTVIVAPDNAAIKEALDDGLSLEWAHYAERGTTLRLK